MSCRLPLVVDVCLLFVAILALPLTSRGEEREGARQAPPGHAIVGETINGWYFAPKELKDEYDSVLSRLEDLQSDVDAGKGDVKKARAMLDELREKLKSLRLAVNATRILVEGADLHEQTETIEFDLGPEKRLAITANKVRVVGWDGPKVKVELKKTVLSPDGKPVDEQLKEIRLNHKHERAEFAGKTDAEWEASEAEFLAKDGATLTPEQRENRKKFVDSIRQSYAIYRDLLGKPVDQITVEGMDYQSNKVVSMNVKSENGDGRMGSVRQRYAEVIAYVPKCVSVTVRGAERGLRVENLAADLVITPHDSTDSDARAKSTVEGLHGNLVCHDFVLNAVNKVKGNVKIELTTENGFEGSAHNHRNGIRTMTAGRAIATAVHNVGGDVDLKFGRVALDLKAIGGTLNVVNRFGNTSFEAQGTLAKTAHRVFSESGRIDVTLSDDAWKAVPILVVTHHGGVRTNVDREEFDDFSLEGEDKSDHSRSTFRGCRTVVEREDRFAVFQLFDRFAAIATGTPRSPGLDLFSRSGNLSVTRE